MNGNTPVDLLIKDAYASLRDADTESAFRSLREALRVDWDHPEAKYALSCLAWWMDKLKWLDEFSGGLEQGSFLMTQWKPFHKFQAHVSGDNGTAGAAAYDACRYALRGFVCSRALVCFTSLLESERENPEILLQIGRCHKGIGNYDEAVQYLGEAVRLKSDDGGALAELADAYALIGNAKAAKAFFREAFFVDPQGVDLDSMESDLILRLRDAVTERGVEGEALAEWMPVYGRLLGVLSIKRVLKPVELSRIKQAVLALEREQRGNAGAPALLKPRLLNRYFWLIDHWMSVGGEAGEADNAREIEETMLKIKYIDEDIYAQYRNERSTR